MSRSSAPGAREGTILVVDDMPANLALLVDHLESAGHQALAAEDAEAALKRASLMKPDLILLDVVMPGIDGFETCRRLKAAEGTRDIPVIFMTCLGEVADKLVGFEAGGVDYITKPFEIEEVLARIRTHLSLREAQKELEAKNAQLLRAQQELEQRVQSARPSWRARTPPSRRRTPSAGARRLLCARASTCFRPSSTTPRRSSTSRTSKDAI